MSAETPFPPAGTLDGQVRAFDRRRGIGTVSGPDANEWFFHATAIADGSRDIAVGAAVRFSLAPGHGGRDEARSIVALVR